MKTYKLVKPAGRRRSWRVEVYLHGRYGGEWTCDSEAIARELLRRLKAGTAPGWLAREFRQKS